MCDGAVVTTSTTARAGFPELAADAPLDLEGLMPDVRRQVRQRLLSPDFDEWSATAARVGYCAHPVRLLGSTIRVHAGTGEVLSSYSSAVEPTGLTYVRCGNRRASECPACPRIYAADTFHLIRSGVTGGKTVPHHVAANPMVFATLTAPSFGHVHGARSNGRRCRPRDKATRCEHGRSERCMQRHGENDLVVGQPICSDCYDYTRMWCGSGGRRNSGADSPSPCADCWPNGSVLPSPGCWISRLFNTRRLRSTSGAA